jgi:hypothetical protein
MKRCAEASISKMNALVSVVRNQGDTFKVSRSFSLVGVRCRAAAATK